MSLPNLSAEKESPVAELKGLLHRYGLRARKGLAQHFLVDRGVLGKIVAAAELSPADTVIEVGPGLGVLTKELAKRAKQIIAIEIDEKLVSVLSETLRPFSNVAIVNANVLEVDPARLLSQYAGSTTTCTTDYKMIANLPYYIAMPTLRHFLEASLKPTRMVVMVQEEVGRNIVARPGEMSILSVSVQLYGSPSIVHRVPAGSFYPRPKVDSVVVAIDVFDKPQADVADVERFFRVVKAGFSAPRKQLHNALAKGLSIKPLEAHDLLTSVEIDPKRRAETLSIEEWARLSKSVR
ncbi:MAG: ribosomal RNA small subunit methyltransferase A [Chloroflexi bacterium]|nr:ribosomal RNA small subunit methyltransferase A [Chloroflexota bacterium]